MLKLFSEEPLHFDYRHLYLSSVSKSISRPQSDLCEGLLTLDELTTSLQRLNLGKSPRSDGLTVEFNLHFWEILDPLVLLVADQCFRLRTYGLFALLGSSLKSAVT